MSNEEKAQKMISFLMQQHHLPSESVMDNW